MKKFALMAVLALEMAVCGCGNSTPQNTTNTEAKGNWEAQLTGGTDQAALLNFVTAFADRFLTCRRLTCTPACST